MTTDESMDRMMEAVEEGMVELQRAQHSIERTVANLSSALMNAKTARMIHSKDRIAVLEEQVERLNQRVPPLKPPPSR